MSNYVAQAELAMEYAALQNKDHLPLGMTVIPSRTSILIWEGVLFVHQGYYADAILKFQVHFPNDYPNHPPAVRFLTDIFHPLIAQEDGSLNISPRFSVWRPKQDHAFDVLHYIKLAFKKQTLDGLMETECLNKEAYSYRDSTTSFAALALQSASLSQSAPALFEGASSTGSTKGLHRNISKPSQPDIFFQEVKESDLDAVQKKLGLRDWQ